MAAVHECCLDYQISFFVLFTLHWNIDIHNLIILNIYYLLVSLLDGHSNLEPLIHEVSSKRSSGTNGTVRRKMSWVLIMTVHITFIDFEEVSGWSCVFSWDWQSLPILYSNCEQTMWKHSINYGELWSYKGLLFMPWFLVHSLLTF